MDGPTVFVVDDDPEILRLLADLLPAHGHHVKTYTTAGAFLEDYDLHQPGCLVLDINLPDISGLELQRRLTQERVEIPIVVLTGGSDINVAREAFRGGIVDFVPKPFQNQDLLAAVDEALLKDAQNRERREQLAEIRERFNRLSPREREVVDLMVDGRSTKEIAFQLGLSSKTIDVHRSNSMSKLEVDSVAELVRMAVALNPDHAPPRSRATN